MRRLAIVVVLCLAVAAAFVVFNPVTLWPTSEPEPGPLPRATATAVLNDLEATFEATDGEIVFTGEWSISDPQSGTISWIIAPESTVQAGDVLYERDSQPVVLLTGDIPAWRTLAVDDVGADVAQLESNLVALGYGDEADLTIDETFTTATATVVRRWQADLGIEETGVVVLGDVVFGPELARVGSVAAAVGDQSDEMSLLTLSTVERQIVFTVAADTIGFIRLGSAISVRLPDRSTLTGVVDTIAPAGLGISRLTASLSGQDVETLPVGDSIPVTVSWTDVVASDAVTVPAGAIIRLDRGVYAVETVTDSGVTGVTIVELGAQVGSQVQILSGLETDVRVVAP